MGLDFRVNRHVLIPRQDTETLVELVLQEQKDSKRKVLDLCTGSGCIAISLAVIGGYEEVTAADVSEEALATARENASRLLKPGQTVAFFQGDLFQALCEKKFDVLVSNPPYIPTEILQDLQPEVRDHEPRIALDGAEEGLGFYRRIVAEAADWLNPGAGIYLEIGYDQGKAVSALLKKAGFQEIKVTQDLAGLDRVVSGVLP